MDERKRDPKFQLMAIASRIVIKCFRADTKEHLFFIIVNDTVHLFRYQRAVLVSLEKGKPRLLAISGQADLPADPEYRDNWSAFFSLLDGKSEMQLLDSAKSEKEMNARKLVHIPRDVSLIWFPLFFENKLAGGLLLEEGLDKKRLFSHDDVLDVMENFLGPCYGAAWGRFERGDIGKKILGFFRSKWIWFVLAIILSLFLIRVPLRIVAPAEIVPKDPVVITAPLDGIVEEVVVRPGEEVKKDQVLFEYDKEVALRNLGVSEKEVEILQSEVDRALTLGFTDPQSLQELAVLQLKLKKERIKLDLAKYQVSRLTVQAPEPGIVVIGNPFEWRGKPVEVGERVMELSDPQRTMVRIWIPESDNIPFEEERAIKVYLNVTPEVSYLARLNYVANESVVDKNNVVSFVAEADWVEEPEGIKIGLKGTAVLYGKRVSLFYWMIRRPWAYLRYLSGL